MSVSDLSSTEGQRLLERARRIGRLSLNWSVERLAFRYTSQGGGLYRIVYALFGQRAHITEMFD